ncbi:probable RNA-directed DNA polymerase from transposon BS [Hydra vulgaris]|uniref:probable RNA-directed DNA polymerase from transposon BS n=1 Tax=Hydra vulgaris TaxID=6087 RepID=UPI0032EA0B31
MSLTYNADLINGNILDLILTETPERINIITDKNGSLQTNRDDIANILNENFHSVFVIEDPTNFPNIALKTTKTLELDIDSIITQDIVRIKLSELNVNKALGADGVSSYVLKKCQNSFCKPLELLFKRSLQEEQTPLIWKMANVTPLHKNGDKKIMDYMLANNLLNSNQHGFQKSKSCTTNLLETQDILFDAIENGWCADVLYTDFSKAFDKVPHRRLMSKLISYGIVGVILNWIEAYLHNRKQRVNLGDCVSKWLTVESGVPEGSVLGPLLFLIFINDLPDTLKNNIKLYADDSKIINIFKSDEDIRINKLQLDIDNIMKWSSLWLMKFNYEKCKIMHIGFKNPCITYSMFDAETQQNNILAASKVERDLGVMMQSNLKWTSHIDKAVGKSNQILLNELLNILTQI